jgi:peptidyl-dipeptidase A
MKQHSFTSFLKTFLQAVKLKSKQANQAFWWLGTTGSADAADLKGALDAEFRLLFHDPVTFRQLLQWDNDNHLQDPLLKRQLNVLIRLFKGNQIPVSMIKTIVQKEAQLAQAYVQFRPQLQGKFVSDNKIREILKNQNDPLIRQQVWEASKQVGVQLAPKILELVTLRNRAAVSLGYENFFDMQLDLQEVDAKWLLQTFERLCVQSDRAYSAVMDEISEHLSRRFPKENLGPWAWSDPFCQEDPIDVRELDHLVREIDILSACRQHYQKMGFDVQSILDKSDLFERADKNQHAFCIHMDREGDIRTLNNIKPTLKWLEILLHELGHAVYEQGLDCELPWLLREPPHMISTEAMALLAGRQAYRSDFLSLLGAKHRRLMQKADASLRRRQLIFSRWVLVMTAFERELYRHPTQDLNALWWRLVAQYQKITPPKNREGKADWAAKYHIGLCPVYYYSYLLGDLFASAIRKSIFNECNFGILHSQEVGCFLRQKLFIPGNRWNWMELVRHVTGDSLNTDAWVQECLEKK